MNIDPEDPIVEKKKKNQPEENSTIGSENDHLEDEDGADHHHKYVMISGFNQAYKMDLAQLISLLETVRPHVHQTKPN